MPPPPGTDSPTISTGAIQRVAIIGAGAGGPLSGASLALLCLRAGFQTVLEDVVPGNLRRAAAALAAAGAASECDDRLVYAGSIEDAVRNADLVLDTVPDELESKLEILSLLDRMAPPATLFVTPTESLSIADLASCTYRPGLCVGLRFVAGEPLRITLSYPPAATRETVVRVEAFLRALGATVQAEEDRQPLP